jgi:hypothetical protein
MGPRGALLIAAVLLVCGCRERETLKLGGTSRRVVLSLPLAHDEAERKTPCPLLHVEAKGTKTLFIVDTGANGNALTSWFAADIGISTTSHPEDTARDFAGTAVEVARSEPLKVTANGSVISRGVIGVVSTPILPRQRGIGGVLSPRSMLPPAFSAVLDLPSDRLAIVEGSVQSDPWNGEKSLTPDGTRTCETKGVYLLSAELGGSRGRRACGKGRTNVSVEAATFSV